MHKRVRLTPIDRQNIRQDYCNWIKKKVILADKYWVSRPTIYKILKMMRIKELYPKPSVNHRFRSLEYWLKRLAKVEAKVLKRKNEEAKRYFKNYPGELFHMDWKKLSAIKWDTDKSKEYIIVWIDHYSCEWYAIITEDKTQISTTKALLQFIHECPYSIEKILTDNGKEYKWTSSHTFESLCEQLSITHAYTRVKRPQTNWKAERFIRTLMEMRHEKEEFSSREQRKASLRRFLNRYNTVKPHKTLDWKTPYECLYEFYYWTFEGM